MNKTISRVYSNDSFVKKKYYIQNITECPILFEMHVLPLKKGSLAGVDGKIQTRNYEGQDGKRIYVTEVLAESVQFLEPRNGSGGHHGLTDDHAPIDRSQRSSSEEPINITDEDMPFDMR